MWSITNDHNLPHSFHPHLIHFVVLDIDGDAAAARARRVEGHGLRAARQHHPDRRPGSTTTPTPTTPYMFHCHILRHEDSGMMGQFVVVEPGQQASAPAADHAGHGDG